MLLDLMHGSRPDLSYPVIKLSQYSSKPRTIHWDGVKRIMRYIIGTLDRAILLGDLPHASSSPSTDDRNLVGYFDSAYTGMLLGYFDSAYADNVDKRSTCGYLFLLNGGLISCATKVQRTIALSSTEAEYMAGTEATHEAVWLKGLTDAIFHPSHSELTIQ